MSGRSAPAKLVKTLRAGEGFLAQSSKWLHFGLGADANIESAIVRWPGGDGEEQFERFIGLKADGRYEFVQGTGTARQVSPDGRHVKLHPSDPRLPPRSLKGRLPLMVRLPVPKLDYEAVDGAARTVPAGSGKPVLVNLWSSTCRPCLTELSEFSKRAGELHESGIEIIALCVDGLGDEDFQEDRALGFLDGVGFPFSSGRATRELISSFQRLQDYPTPVAAEFPVPTSFLIDENERLAIIYKGPVSV